MTMKQLSQNNAYWSKALDHFVTIKSKSAMRIHFIHIHLKRSFEFRAIMYCSMMTCYFLNPQSFCPGSKITTNSKNNNITSQKNDKIISLKNCHYYMTVWVTTNRIIFCLFMTKTVKFISCSHDIYIEQLKNTSDP